MPIFKNNMQSVRDQREAILRQQKEREANANFDEINEGANVKRILPPWSAEGQWCKRAYFHYGIKEKGNIVCPKETFGQPCPVCEDVEALFKMKGDEEARELAFQMRAKMRCFANVLNYNKNDGRVYILAFGPKLYADIVTMMFGGDGPNNSTFGCGDVTDVQTGRLIQITKKTNPKDKKLTDYGVTPDSNPSALPNAEAFCNMLHNLDDLILKDTFTYEQIKQLMNRKNGGGGEAHPTQQAAAPGGFGAPAAPAPAPAPAPSSFVAPAPAPAKMTSDFVPPASSFGPPPPAPAPAPSSFATPAPAPAPASAAGKPSSALDRLRAMQPPSA